MRIEYKRTALLDLQQTQDYIANTLKNKPAAQKLVSSVLHDVSLLANNPRMGTALNSRFDVDSDLRFIVVSKQFVFYQIVDDDMISIVRILDGQRDYHIGTALHGILLRKTGRREHNVAGQVLPGAFGGAKIVPHGGQGIWPGTSGEPRPRILPEPLPSHRGRESRDRN